MGRINRLYPRQRLNKCPGLYNPRFIVNSTSSIWLWMTWSQEYYRVNSGDPRIKYPTWYPVLLNIGCSFRFILIHIFILMAFLPVLRIEFTIEKEIGEICMSRRTNICLNTGKTLKYTTVPLSFEIRKKDTLILS